MKRAFALMSLSLLMCMPLSADEGGENPIRPWRNHSNPTSLPSTITIGFIPSGNREALKKGAFIFAKKLQEELNIPISVYLPKSYSSLLTAIHDKKVDFAFLTAASYVVLEKQSQMQVLLKSVWSEPFYYSVILVRKDSNITKFDQLKGKRVAFVDAKSTSGYLYPQVMLKKKGWTDKNFKEVKFSGSHGQSVQMLENGETDAIAVFSDDKDGKKSAWMKFAKNADLGKGVRVLWQSDPIPNDPFCVRQEFYDQYPKVVHSMMFALIDVAEALKDNQDVTAVVAHGFLPATSRQYDPVRELVKELGPPLE